jgi:hypothetical protein
MTERARVQEFFRELKRSEQIAELKGKIQEMELRKAHFRGMLQKRASEEFEERVKRGEDPKKVARDIAEKYGADVEIEELEITKPPTKAIAERREEIRKEMLKEAEAKDVVEKAIKRTEEEQKAAYIELEKAKAETRPLSAERFTRMLAPTARAFAAGAATVPLSLILVGREIIHDPAKGVTQAARGVVDWYSSALTRTVRSIREANPALMASVLGELAVAEAVGAGFAKAIPRRVVRVEEITEVVRVPTKIKGIEAMKIEAAFEKARSARIRAMREQTKAFKEMGVFEKLKRQRQLEKARKEREAIRFEIQRMKRARKIAEELERRGFIADEWARASLVPIQRAIERQREVLMRKEIVEKVPRIESYLREFQRRPFREEVIKRAILREELRFGIEPHVPIGLRYVDFSRDIMKEMNKSMATTLTRMGATQFAQARERARSHEKFMEKMRETTGISIKEITIVSEAGKQKQIQRQKALQTQTARMNRIMREQTTRLLEIKPPRPIVKPKEEVKIAKKPVPREKVEKWWITAMQIPHLLNEVNATFKKIEKSMKEVLR